LNVVKEMYFASSMSRMARRYPDPLDVAFAAR